MTSAAEPAVNRTEATFINATVPPPPSRPPATPPATAAAPEPAPMPAGGAPMVRHAPEPAPAPQAAKPVSSKALVGVLAGGVLLVAAAVGTYMFVGRDRNAPTTTAQGGAPGTVATAPASSPATAPAIVPAVAGDPPQESGYVTISALGLVDPKDPKFNGDAGAAQAEARADAKRQLVEKAMGMYIDANSLNKNYAILEQKLLSQPGAFIKTVLQEGAPTTGKDGLLETETRAVVKSRDVQKSLNQLSKDERIEFIRNNGDPKVAIQMSVANADTGQNFPPIRSQVAENIIKERVKSFGFRVWANEGETATGPNARAADFVIQGEAKVKQLSARLAASGITVTKTVLTSWTVKAIDKASGEEIYLNTVTPKRQSWASEDEALSDIGKLVGEEFSKNFFLQYFNVGVRQTSLDVTGLPDAQTARLLLRELRGVRQVLDVQLVADSGKYRLLMAQNSPVDVIQDAIVKPLNTKLGKPCFALAASSETAVSVTYSSACADAAVRGRLETAPPAGLLDAPASRGKPLLKGRPSTMA